MVKKTLITLLILAAAGYLYSTCAFLISEGSLGLVENREDGSVLRVLPAGYRFIWQGALWNRVTVLILPVRNTDLYELKIPVPPLETLESDFYSVRLPLSVTYEINPSLAGLEGTKLKRGGKPMTETAGKILESALRMELSPYLSPNYRRHDLERDRARILEKAGEVMKKNAAGRGIAVLAVEYAGIMQMPEMNTYYEGFRFYQDLLNIEKNNKKELIIIANNLQKEKIIHKQYLEKLGDIARLIKGNPDLLKYIYMDRLSGNVKVIISSDKTGMPFGLDFSDSEKKQKKGEIDNLRY